jgi:RNA polymerase sigma factor (sigma-70 family)
MAAVPIDNTVIKEHLDRELDKVKARPAEAVPVQETFTAYIVRFVEEARVGKRLTHKSLQYTDYTLAGYMKLVLQQIKGGDRKAFSVLVKQYQGLVFHVVQRIVTTPEDVEDISQEVFIKVYRQLNTFAFESKLATWIARIAYLTAIDYLRKFPSNSTDCAQPVDQLQFTHDTPEQLLIQSDVSSYVQKLIDTLPESYRVVLTLYHLEEFSHAEIEQITGMPVGTIKSYLFRARKLLKDRLAISLKEDS